MKCSLCENKAIYDYESGYLCKNHFLKYFEKKFYHTITKYKLIDKNDTIAVGFSGGKDSTTMLYLLNKFCSQRKIKMFAILIDEGIKGYRPNLISYAKKFCKKEKIKLHIFAYTKEYGKTLDSVINQNPKEHPCSLCGVLRRNILNKHARKLGATKLAIGHNLDDEAQTLLLNVMQNKVMLIARSGMMPGFVHEKRFVKRIKPLYFLKEKEIMLYAMLRGFKTEHTECPYATKSMRYHIRMHLNALNDKFKHVKSNIVRANLELVELLKKNYQHEHTNTCAVCGEPASSEICNTCKLLEMMNKKK